MPTHAPSVFVSSTFYDLQQIRADVRDFIESLGLRPVLSEFNSFPVDPDERAMDNCFKVVEESADIFILIIGGRYGSTNDEGKSVTNLEYLRARAKGVPVYAFVQQSILHNQQAWKNNPDGDFTGIVDSSSVFDFVAQVRESSGVWVFPFSLAQDIIETLRSQFAFLFMDALSLRRRLTSAGLYKRSLNFTGCPSGL